VTIDDVMTAAPVIPVLVLDGSVDPAVLAVTLVGAGVPALEVTLRTPQALDAIRAMAKVPGAIIGAGTVLNAIDMDKAIDAGAQFLVSPGLTQALARRAIERRVAYLPGVATASDIMRGLDLGLTRFKFFPAMAAGGIPALKAQAAVFGDVRFCPTGGISEETAPDWLALEAVLCVGGSWVTGKGAPDYVAVGEAARRASRLAR